MSNYTAVDTDKILAELSTITDELAETDLGDSEQPIADSLFEIRRELTRIDAPIQIEDYDGAYQVTVQSDQ